MNGINLSESSILINCNNFNGYLFTIRVSNSASISLFISNETLNLFAGYIPKLLGNAGFSKSINGYIQGIKFYKWFFPFEI